MGNTAADVFEEAATISNVINNGQIIRYIDDVNCGLNTDRIWGTISCTSLIWENVIFGVLMQCADWPSV